ncbi:MAG: GspE/PulE family protein [Flavobacteriales bacterium]|nr:GspE/PulE family protein [Flavobacteriales bacterium]
MSEPLDIDLTTDLQQLISVEQAWHYRIIPFQDSGSQIEFYIDESAPSSVTNELEILFDRKVLLKPVSATSINKFLSKFYRKAGSVASVRIQDNYDIAFLYQLISEAKALGSSDIHIEIYEEKARIRFRIDGVLIEKYKLQKTEYAGLISIVKVKAKLNISEKRLPQDGRIKIKNEENDFDLRVSVLPTLVGEKVVMRILANDTSHLSIKKLGLSEKQFSDYESGVKKPHGIVLISGPTGSGKTTTLYATLKELNVERRNIMTVEDPVEYTLDGINQVQLNEQIGLTFAAALRSFLRQDPDIIMLGEIRDEETAHMAIRAALTGHLVLSTVHTNSAWEIISRLTDMNVPPFLIANTLNLAVSQRLLRTLCSNCKQEAHFDHEYFGSSYKFPQSMDKHWLPVGCEQCFYTGYKGRKAVYEIIPIDLEFTEKIRNKTFDVKSLKQKKGITSLQENAFNLFYKGETSFEEVYPIFSTL